MVLLQLTLMTPDGCYGGDDDEFAVVVWFYPVVALCLSAEVALLRTTSAAFFPCCTLSSSLLVVVLLLAKMRADGCTETTRQVGCGGPIFWSESALLRTASDSHCLCCVFSLLHSFLPAVGGAPAVGDDEGRRLLWW